MAKLEKTGFGSIELNLIAARNTGMMRAQYPLFATDFPAGTYAENGMLLVVDDVLKHVRFADANTEGVWLHASVEKVYNQFEQGLDKFAFDSTSGRYPRLYKLYAGDIVTTNTARIVETVPETEDFELIDANVLTGIYGYAGTDGYIDLTDVQDVAAAVELQVIDITTMPNGEIGIKFVVNRA